MIIHIGMNKTGSTAIQSFFIENYKLRVVPDCFSPKPDETVMRSTCFSPMRSDFNSIPGKDRPGRSIWKSYADLDAETADAGPHTVLISSEDFSRCRPLDATADFFAGYAPKILIYLRRHDHWMASRYSNG